MAAKLVRVPKVISPATASEAPTSGIATVPQHNLMLQRWVQFKGCAAGAFHGSQAWNGLSLTNDVT